MIFFQILICAYVVFLIWDLYHILHKAHPNWNKKALLLILTLFLVPGMYKHSLYFPFVIYILVFTLLIQLIMWIIKRPVKLWMILLCVFGSFCYTTYGYFHFQNRIEMNYSIKTDKEVPDTRILFISDLHYPNGLTKSSLDSLVKKLNETHSNIVLIGGDLTDEQTTKKDMEQCIQSLKPLTENSKVFYIYGNHDLQPKIKNKKFTKDEFEEQLQNANITVLNDQSVVCDNINIIGRSDYALKNRLDVTDLLKDVDPDRFTVLVDHQPIETKQLLDSGKIDLMISGHTHNGQLYPFGYLLDLYWKCDLRYGINDLGSMTAITSSGVNAWGFPARTMGTSEYVVIDVTHA
ncbi:hypothetical protein C815_02241 [Firmicutes bacterium M10-2]|nr:hypothetical protein C815_02241 [Firmicutes bacterium M10-2]